MTCNNGDGCALVQRLRREIDGNGQKGLKSKMTKAETNIENMQKSIDSAPSKLNAIVTLIVAIIAAGVSILGYIVTIRGAKIVVLTSALLLTGCQTFKLTEGLEVNLISLSYHKHQHNEVNENEKSNKATDGDSNSAVNDNPFANAPSE